MRHNQFLGTHQLLLWLQFWLDSQLRMWRRCQCPGSFLLRVSLRSLPDCRRVFTTAGTAAQQAAAKLPFGGNSTSCSQSRSLQGVQPISDAPSEGRCDFQNLEIYLKCRSPAEGISEAPFFRPAKNRPKSRAMPSEAQQTCRRAPSTYTSCQNFPAQSAAIPGAQQYACRTILLSCLM